jgi:hypothetical protein
VRTLGKQFHPPRVRALSFLTLGKHLPAHPYKRAIGMDGIEGMVTQPPRPRIAVVMDLGDDGGANFQIGQAVGQMDQILAVMSGMAGRQQNVRLIGFSWRCQTKVAGRSGGW